MILDQYASIQVIGMAKKLPVEEINPDPTETWINVEFKFWGFEVNALVSYTAEYKETYSGDWFQPPEGEYMIDNVVVEEVNLYKDEDCVELADGFKLKFEDLIISKINIK